MILPRRLVYALAAFAALATTGCASVPPWPGSPGAPPASTRPQTPGKAPAQVPSQRPGTSTSVVPADSTPTPEALEVLATIPEPLRTGEHIAPAPNPGPANPSSTSPDDTSAVSSQASDMPVPEPTQVMGERRAIAIDTTTSAPGAAPPQQAPGAPSHPELGSAPAGADTCWRVQILAPLDSPAAEQARATAASQLLVPMVIEQEQGRYKVRTRDCMNRSTADLLRRRAIDSGFTQAFRISSVKK